MIYAIITVLVVCIIGAAIWLSGADDCPRMILGYKCRGVDCDHSPEELMRAKQAMKRR